MKYFLAAIFGVALIGLIITLNVKVESNFEKPTLLRASHQGGFNEATIDFKTDGTYIFDNAATELKDFKYGRYRIDGNKIRLDKSEIDSVIKTNFLKIKLKKSEVDDQTENYLYQVNEEGEELKNKAIFKVLVDNRKEVK